MTIVQVHSLHTATADDTRGKDHMSTVTCLCGFAGSCSFSLHVHWSWLQGSCAPCCINKVWRLGGRYGGWEEGGQS